MRDPRANDPRNRWTDRGSGQHYAEARWSSDARRSRDPRRIGRLLARHAPRTQAGLVLDAPCGSGRLRPLLEAQGRYVGLDVSCSMLKAAGEARLIRGELEHLPLRDASFEVVVCCRLLHHLADEARLAAIVSELVRVSSAWIVVTFWDALSLPALRRRLLPRRRAYTRQAHRRARIQEAFTAAGAEILEWDASLRFISRQTYGIARRVDLHR